MNIFRWTRLVRVWIAALVFLCGMIHHQPTALGQLNEGLAPSSFPAETPPLNNPPPPLPDSIDTSAPMKMNVPETKIDPLPADGLHWYYPWTWIPSDGWENNIEAGFNGSEGNSQSFSLQGGIRFKRKVEASLFELRLTHNQTQAAGIETQNNTLLYTDYDRGIGKSKWSWFNKTGLEQDEFKAFDLRFFVNGGLTYRFKDTKDLRIYGRFGAGTSREFGGPDDAWIPEGVFGGDYDHQINDRNKLIIKADFYPNWTDFSDFRIVSDFAWEYLLDQKHNLSMKLGATDRYDSTPHGLKPNDLNYTLMLLYKF